MCSSDLEPAVVFANPSTPCREAASEKKGIGGGLTVDQGISVASAGALRSADSGDPCESPG